MPSRSEILEVKIDLLSRDEAEKRITGWVNGKDHNLKLVVTVYSEFLVRASKDSEFKTILNQADLAVPDGISILAANRYQDRVRKGGNRVCEAVRVAGDILRSGLGETVTGVYLFEKLIKIAARDRLRVFLLGGFGDRATRLKSRLLLENPGLMIEADKGEKRVGTDEKENNRVIAKINDFKPDLLFVAYGPVRQEKWIMRNRERLKVKVAMGVGGTFDEVLEEVKRAPLWMEKRGLKWLWRLIVQPKRIGRIYKAVVVFPWKVFRAV